MKIRMTRCVTIAAILFCVCAAFEGLAQEAPKESHWKHFPMAHDKPMLPLPSDEELLKVVPPLRRAPDFSEEQRRLGVALWWGDYSTILYAEQPPCAEDFAREPELRTPAGEDEPLILGVWGITHTGTLSLLVKESPFPVTIRQVEWARRYLPVPYYGMKKVEGGRAVGFATYLPENGATDVRPGENAVYWINVAVPPDTKPGRYEIKLQLIVHDVDVVELPASVEVLPFELPRADIAYGMYFRGAGGKDNSARYNTPELLRAYWRDMARHGMTSATHYMYTRSGCFADKDGSLKDLDRHLSVQRLLEMKADGLVHADIPIMLLSSSLAKYPEAGKAVAEYLKQRGLPELLLYGWDEPPVNDEARAQFEAMRASRQYMRNVTAISDHAATAYADLIDVWTVQGGQVTPELQALGKEKGAELWTYDCYHRGRGNSTRARFYAGLYTWALNLKGNFHWCYTGANYTWEGDHNAIHCFVLPSDGGPVPSVAWEARREGVEDYRLLRLLEKRIAAQPESEAAKEAKKWLDDLRARVDWDLGRDMPMSVYPWDGPEVYPMCPNFQPEELSQIRSRSIDAILALSK